ncbi:uncharacterized protein LOC133292612 [Gastrolobium bilobum]|uniref:uncharacterized protein LOC133292612 n=1 Tax=Gastrolobium bilobum TaxID=150636 RepID=UPI002AB2468A|nr:uncharacterized protein LOC133292612 [Gastrolobium bilobum]
MVAKESYSDQEAGNEENTLLQDPYEEEETLSLSDLPIHSDSNSGQRGDFSKEDGKNSAGSYNKEDNGDDDDFFEFFSEEFTTSSTHATAENIIFCGKLIPFKDHPHVHNRGKSLSDIQEAVTISTHDGGGSFKKGQEAKGSKSFACDYTSIGKVSLMRSTTKSRWFLFMFGMSKLSTTEMELRDIRNRQSRRVPATMFPAPEQGEEVKIKARRSCKGMCKMLRSISWGLGCSSSKLANDVVKAAFV